MPIQQANRAHVCDICKRGIAAGTFYVTEQYGPWCGSDVVWNMKAHDDCDNAFWVWLDEPSSNDFHDDAHAFRQTLRDNRAALSRRLGMQAAAFRPVSVAGFPKLGMDFARCVV